MAVAATHATLTTEAPLAVSASGASAAGPSAAGPDAPAGATPASVEPSGAAAAAVGDVAGDVTVVLEARGDAAEEFAAAGAGGDDVGT